jgi:hypothetical protein
MNSWIDFGALGKALAASLIGGVGLAVFFALGLLGLSAAEDALDPPSTTGSAAARLGRTSGRVLAVACFAIVILGVAAGFYVILTD